MATSAWLAATKLMAPARRHDALFRDRLTDSIKRSLTHSRLTLVSAPAGSGKSTLLAEPTHTFPEFRFCWLLLDSEDNDPARFTSALIASLHTAGILGAAEDPAPNEPRMLVTSLINRIADVRRRIAFLSWTICTSSRNGRCTTFWTTFWITRR